MLTNTLVLCGLLAGSALLQPQPTQPLPQGHPAPSPKAPAPRAAQPAKDAAPDKPIPAARAEDVGSLDAIVKAFYAATAGEPGNPRDWDRFRSLFVNEARMIPVRHAVHGSGHNELLTMPVEGYIELNKNYFEKGGFLETELSRRAEQFGNIAQVWSTFESRRSSRDPKPYTRGVYSIQLAFDGERWWIVNVMWDTEQENARLPDKYLDSKAGD